MKTTFETTNAKVDHSDPDRTNLANANQATMVKLMLQYNLLISARTVHLWRPTERTSGSIDGIRNGLEIIATDGLLGYFITPDGQAWCGHIQCFDGKVKPLHGKSFSGPMTKQPKKPREKSRRQQIIDSI